MRLLILSSAVALLAGCSAPPPSKPAAEKPKEVFHVDAATAGSVTGSVKFTGKKPAVKKIDMDQDLQCAKMHKDGVPDEEVVVNKNGTLANVFVYLKSGLEGKNFEVPKTAVTIDQHGCWFQPRVLGIQVGQTLNVTNTDPLTHNIHPLAQVNREWNHSQAPEDGPLARRFLKPETMIKVKCNIHNWMRAWIGVVEHPYFAVTGADGSFSIPNVPPGTYTVAAWQEKYGWKEQQVTVAPSGKLDLTFTYQGD